MIRLDGCGTLNWPVYVDAKDVSAILPSDFDPNRNSVIVMKNGERIPVRGTSDEIERKVQAEAKKL